MNGITHRSTRRALLQQMAVASVVSGAGLHSALVHASSTPLPLSRSLPQELALAQKLRQPLVVMVSLKGCPFCDVVRNSHLSPMLRREGLPVVQVDMQSDMLTEDFTGKAVSHGQLVRNWRISIAPTVLFFGKGGQEIAERMEGGYLPDFYGSYLDDRLTAARSKV